jgi:hypothetical protein
VVTNILDKHNASTFNILMLSPLLPIKIIQLISKRECMLSMPLNVLFLPIVSFSFYIGSYGFVVCNVPGQPTLSHYTEQ